MWTWFEMKIHTQFTTVPFNRYLSSNKEEIIICLSQSVFHYSSTSHIYPENRKTIIENTTLRIHINLGELDEKREKYKNNQNN